jgi:hypothetical protein
MLRPLVVVAAAVVSVPFALPSMLACHRLNRRKRPRWVRRPRDSPRFSDVVAMTTHRHPVLPAASSPPKRRWEGRKGGRRIRGEKEEESNLVS